MSSRRKAYVLFIVLSVLLCVAVLVVRHLRQPVNDGGKDRILVYDVPSTIDEAPPTVDGFSFSALRRDRPTLHEIAEGIRRAADDDEIHALVLHISGTSWGWARIAEMRSALSAFRASHKMLYASLDGGGEGEYLLASSANIVAMPATSTLQLDGLSVAVTFLKGGYDKLGITPNYAHVGQFKSAVEQYTRTSMSPPARAAMESLLDDLYTVLVDSLAVSRHMPADSLRRLVDEGPFLAEDAHARGLIDMLLDEGDVDTLAVHTGGRHLVIETLPNYLDDGPHLKPRTHLALVVASGEIVSGRSHDNPWQGQQLGAESIIAALRDARQRKDVRAVVLRIDSPGGSGEASEAIWQEVRRVRRAKPVVVSMSNYAASGGYYIACGADEIFAEPGTLTGSIGVFGGKLNVLGLYKKLGLNVETVTRGRHALMFSPYTDFTPEEAERFQHQLEAFYRVFLARVAEGRHLTTAQVDSIGQGRVWSGTAARRIGLVDALGGLPEAVDAARHRAHIPEDEEVVLDLYPRPHRNILQKAIGDAFSEPEDEQSSLAALSPALSSWLSSAQFPTGKVLARMPWTVEIR